MSSARAIQVPVVGYGVEGAVARYNRQYQQGIHEMPPPCAVPFSVSQTRGGTTVPPSVVPRTVNSGSDRAGDDDDDDVVEIPAFPTKVRRLSASKDDDDDVVVEVPAPKRKRTNGPATMPGMPSRFDAPPRPFDQRTQIQKEVLGGKRFYTWMSSSSASTDVLARTPAMSASGKVRSKPWTLEEIDAKLRENPDICIYDRNFLLEKRARLGDKEPRNAAKAAEQARKARAAAEMQRKRDEATAIKERRAAEKQAEAARKMQEKAEREAQKVAKRAAQRAKRMQKLVADHAGSATRADQQNVQKADTLSRLCEAETDGALVLENPDDTPSIEAALPFSEDESGGADLEAALQAAFDEGADDLPSLEDEESGADLEAALQAAFDNDAAVTTPPPENGDSDEGLELALKATFDEELAID